MDENNTSEFQINSRQQKKVFIEPELKAFDELEKQTRGFDFSGPRTQLISQFSP
jgi:hypothetical protein